MSTNPISEELLPCPFCGGIAYITKMGVGWYAECSNDDCGAEVAGTTDRLSAVAAWNHRAADSRAKQAVVETSEARKRVYAKLAEEGGGTWATYMYAEIEEAFADLGSANQAVVTERLGRFDHHPDPAIDFEIEVQALEARLFDAKGKISKPGTEPETVAAVLADIDRAMTFTVGGDHGAVAAKATLRGLEASARAALSRAEGQEPVAVKPLEDMAIQIDAEWRKKGGLNCTEVCAIIRSALVASPEQVVWLPINSAPEDEHIILCTTGGHVGEAIMLRDEDTGEQKWTWALGPVHPTHTPLGWMPMPPVIYTAVEA